MTNAEAARSDAIVVGGGITGLAAAYTLSRSGAAVTLVEPETLGGVISTVKTRGFTLEQGPNVLLAKADLLRLLQELGMGDEIVAPKFARFRQMVWSGDRAETVPKSLLQFIRSRLFDAAAKWRVLCALARPARLAPQESDESVFDFLSRLIGEAAVMRVADPALKGIYGGSVRRLSARSIFPRLWEAATERRSLLRARKGPSPKVIVLRDGMGSLVARLQERVAQRVHRLSRRAASIAHDPSKGFTVTLDDGSQLFAPRVAVATSGEHTAELIEGLDPALAQDLRRLRFASLVVVHYAVPRDRVITEIPEDAFGVLFPEGVDGQLLGVMYNSALFPHVAPPDKHLLTVCFGGVNSEALFRKSDRDLFALVQRELAHRFGIPPGEGLLVTRWPRAIPQYEVGHFRLVEALRNAEKDFPGLSFVGLDSGGVGVADRVRMGMSVTV